MNEEQAALGATRLSQQVKPITSLSHSACSDIGLVRSDNEDAFGNEDCLNGQLFMVFDGLGGHTSGQLAAELALDAIGECLAQRFFENPLDGIVRAIELAHERIANENHLKTQSMRMGTTAVVALFRDGLFYFAHVGDSRLYLFRNKILTQLTHDHTYVQGLVDKQVITPEEAREHPERSRLTRALGIYSNAEPELCRQPIVCRAGDLLLLCTDGLTEMLPDDEIADYLQDSDSLQETVEKLIEEAKSAGGFDNITAMLIRIN